ncbi:hypothetical protein [Sporolituus thermophilus]|uniref:Uncharacterized protein n=1 Tax=Sporolituus thermophilus DSM 23256 TaxID=1123285 RepID=A0A1G7JKM0_9FIRM|nr:hypothetical protein [Sporolituus thermophilus]SDF25461.1 hypothetical protein SAMN05660235_00966 [Sporolituus thermophilus DSM 23256]
MRPKLRRMARPNQKQDNEYGQDSRIITNQYSINAERAAPNGAAQGAGIAMQQDAMTSQAILVLLQKISSQLDNLQQTQGGQGGQQSGGAALPSGGQKEAANPQQEAIVTQQLENLFSQILQNKPNPTGLQGRQQGQQEQQGGLRKTQSGENKVSSVAVQTAAQVLAQAQYELSNELEASLKKLKQVINESEKIANKISNLLGEENKGQQSR